MHQVLGDSWWAKMYTISLELQKEKRRNHVQMWKLHITIFCHSSKSLFLFILRNLLIEVWRSDFNFQQTNYVLNGDILSTRLIRSSVLCQFLRTWWVMGNKTHRGHTPKKGIDNYLLLNWFLPQAFLIVQTKVFAEYNIKF